jgi:hypothetical protein
MRVMEFPSVLPDVTGRDLDGQVGSLSGHYRPGRYTLAWWHPQVLSPLACRTCGGGATAEPVRLLMSIYEAGCDVVGLSFGDPVELSRYLNEIGIEYPKLSVTPDEGRRHGVTKVAGEEWESLPRRVAFLVGEDGAVINRYEVHDPKHFLRTVLGDVKAGPPTSQWEPPKKSWWQRLVS